MALKVVLMQLRWEHNNRQRHVVFSIGKMKNLRFSSVWSKGSLSRRIYRKLMTFECFSKFSQEIAFATLALGTFPNIDASSEFLFWQTFRWIFRHEKNYCISSQSKPQKLHSPWIIRMPSIFLHDSFVKSLPFKTNNGRHVIDWVWWLVPDGPKW